ncbi:hypothetical protein [uncultured Abiotrophia sp.]|uniref:hypothetical protein n=1 Tax=uncultured Abiotrophia sp. TaxID=316094 RepID=UPI0026260D2C|nr:hypothetical protein [uncultured Abiotrophia sp.]
MTRAEWLTTHPGARLLNDAYNASPTFVLSVQSFVLVASLYCVWLVLGILLP